jgi:hypothetical protein
MLSHHLRYILETLTARNTTQVASAGHSGQPAFLQAAVAARFKASADDRGTVQALAKELDEAQEDGTVH